MHKKKILHIITSLGDGGAEGVLYRLISGSIGKFHHEVIALSVDKKYEKLLKKKRIKVYNINLSKNKIQIKKIFKLYSIIKKKKDYIIQTWLYHADFLGGLLGYISGNRNIYWNIRTSEISFKSTKLKTLIIIFLNAILSWIIPKKIIICSQNSINIHKSVGYKNKFKLIHNGFDKKIYLPKKNYVRKNFNLRNHQVIIGCVARFHAVKNHDYLLSIFSKIKDIPNIRLVLIGTKMDENNLALMEKIKKYNIQDKVKLLGKRNDVFYIYKLFDIFILTSLSEGFPNVLAEAMINKNICLSTNVGDTKAIINNNKFIIPKNDIKKSAEMLKKLIKKKNSKQWFLIKNKNKKQIIDNFSLIKMVKEYSYVWNS